MSKPEPKYGKYPERIETKDILNPETRWICQRLDRLDRIIELLEYLAKSDYLKSKEADDELRE